MRSNRKIALAKSLTLIVLAYFLFPFQNFACSPHPQPLYKLKAEGIPNCNFGPAGEEFNSNTDIIEFVRSGTSPKYSDCDSVNLSESEQLFFKRIISNFKDKDIGFATGFFVKQTDEEYQTLLRRNGASQDDNCSCRIYDDIERDGNWTFYIDTWKKTSCSIGFRDGQSCQLVPPEECGDQFNDYFDGSISSPGLNTRALLIPTATFVVLFLFLTFLLYRRNKS